MWNGKGQTAVEYVEFDKINELLKFARDFRAVLFEPPIGGLFKKDTAYIRDGVKMLEMTMTIAGRRQIFRFLKDGSGASEKVSGEEAFRCLSLYYKVPRLEEFSDKMSPKYMSAAPFIWKNDAYEKKRVYAYEYDLNSAYGAAMLGEMPDTSAPMRAGHVKENEIGFIELPKKNGDGLTLVSTRSGYSSFIFPAMDSPFKAFVENWYKKKQNPETRAKAKGVLNFSVGYLQRVNVFLRAAILTACNEYICNLLDKNSIYSNTDSIVSLTPREDLIIGDGVGEWKKDNEGLFAFVGFNYQWRDDPPAYRGVPKSWFKKGWDILRDELPKTGNLYYLDHEKLKVKKSPKGGTIYG